MTEDKTINRLKTLFTKSISKFDRAIKSFQAKFVEETNQKIYLNELVQYVKDHPNTLLRSSTYLNLTFNQYELREELVTYKLLTKGTTTEHVLEFKIYENTTLITSYLSYKDSDKYDKFVVNFS